ncbi:acetyltransferase [Rhizobium sp. LEGMi198b]
MQDIVIFGTGQIADVAKVYIDVFGPGRVVGFTLDEDHMTTYNHCGLPVVAWEHLEARFPPDKVKLLGPLSYQRLNDFRRERHIEGRARGYSFASFIHPSVQNLAESIGDNAFILENCILQPFVRIGDGCMLWTACHIGHHTTIDDYCFLSSQVGVASGVHIGAGCLIGGQVGIDNALSVGASSYIQSRAMIRRNLPAQSVVRHAFDSPETYSSARLKKMKFL